MNIRSSDRRPIVTVWSLVLYKYHLGNTASSAIIPDRMTRDETAKRLPLIELALVLGGLRRYRNPRRGNVPCASSNAEPCSSISFLLARCAVIGLLLTKTIGNAEDYRIFANRNNAASGTPGGIDWAGLTLWMRHPKGPYDQPTHGAFRPAILSFDEPSAVPHWHLFFPC